MRIAAYLAVGIVVIALIGYALYSESLSSPGTIDNRRANETGMPPDGVPEDNTTVSTYPAASDFDVYAIHELKEQNFTSGTFNTEGYVVKIYTCPPCPAGSVCSLCMGDNIVISETNVLLEEYDISETELIVFAEDPEQFVLGAKYLFSVEVLDRHITLDTINDVRLLGYETL